MKKITRPTSMQRLALQWRQEGHAIALVPTMGYLHDGHAALIQRARKTVGKHGKVVVSLFVNPTQFGPKEDFERYPRSEKADLALCRRLGSDAVFAPQVNDIYPSEDSSRFSTYVEEQTLSQSMEGQSRPIHFRGVATVVTILFELTQPTHAIFGEKDYQQTAVVKRMVRDLWIPTQIIVHPTFREKDGLAVSSRNAYLTPEHRAQATVLWECIQFAREKVRGAQRAVLASSLKRQLVRLINQRPAAQLDYIEFFDSETLAPQKHVRRNQRIALAVRFGQTRLIDNGKL